MLFWKSKNVAAQKLCGGLVAQKLLRKLTYASSFCNVVGCKSQISMELGYAKGDLLEKFKEKNLAKASFLKLLTQENVLFISLQPNDFQKTFLAKKPCDCN